MKNEIKKCIFEIKIRLTEDEFFLLKTHKKNPRLIEYIFELNLKKICR